MWQPEENHHEYGSQHGTDSRDGAGGRLGGAVNVVDDVIRILTGDCRDVLKTLPDASVQCCVTSPPYYGLRDYGVAGQIGLEQTPAEYVAHLVAVFREVRRVLRDNGTVWLNLGDSYNRVVRDAGLFAEVADGT